jgi:hypothetical protein
MKLLFGAIIVLIAMRVAAETGMTLGPIAALLLWLGLAWYFPKAIAAPVKAICKYSKWLFKVTLSRPIRMWFFGFMVYMTVPLAAPVLLVVWLYQRLWRKRRKEAKPKFRPLGVRHHYTERKWLNRTSDTVWSFWL